MHNLRAALLMVLAMAAFACEDALLKGLSGTIPTGQLLAVIGFAGMVVFALWIAIGPEGLRLRNLLRPPVMLRNLCEGICAITFVTALATGDLSIASAILQAQPLLMTLGAALFLGEQVGWRRWLSIAAGFAGVKRMASPPATVPSTAPRSARSTAASCWRASRRVAPSPWRRDCAGRCRWRA